MLKGLLGLLTGAGIFLAGLVLGVVLLGKPGAVGGAFGPEITFPVIFNDSVTIGTGNVTLEGVHCITQSVTLATLGSNATTTFGLTLAGANTSTNQVYLVDVLATSSLDVIFKGTVTSTAGRLEVNAHNLGATMLAGTKTAKACYIQF